MGTDLNFLVGKESSLIYEVKPEHCAEHIGSGSLPVLGTPALVTWMEGISHTLVESHLDPGYTSVGTAIQVKHISPTMLGETIKMTCEVTQVDSRQILIEVHAWDTQDLIFEGQHSRVVIDPIRFMDRVKAKAQ
jgi:predicted thioesterase